MKYAAFFFAVLMAQAATAGKWHPPKPPLVIYDAGGTRPIAPLARASGLGPDEEDMPRVRTQAPTWNLFPVKSEMLSPGVSTTLVIDRPMPPVCLVGDDARSLAWLEASRDRLAQLGASCLAVSVADERAWRRIRAAAGPIPIMPGSGDDIARMLGVRHYPVLIGPRGIGP